MKELKTLFLKILFTVIVSLIFISVFEAFTNKSNYNTQLSSLNAEHVVIAEQDRIDDVKNDLLLEIEKFKSVNKDFYTNDSYNDYLIKLNKAISIYNSINSSIEEITNILQSLKLSYEGLTLISNKDNLKTILDYVKLIDLNKYTPNTVDQLSIEYDKALKVYNDNFCLEEDIKNSLLSVNNCINNLELIADFTKLELLINKWEDTDKKIFYESSVEYVNSVYNKIKLVYNDKNSKQSIVDLAYAEFNNALNQLSISGNKGKLITLIKEIKSLEREIYDPSDFEPIEYEIFKIELLMEYDISNDNIERLYDELMDLYKKLDVNESRSNLFAAIKAGKAIDLSDVKEKYKEEFNSLLSEAENLLAEYNPSDEELLSLTSKINDFDFEIGLDDNCNIIWWPNILIWIIATVAVIGTIIYKIDNVEGWFATGFGIIATLLLLPTYFIFGVAGVPYLALWANIVINIVIGLIGYFIAFAVGYFCEDKFA